MTNHQLLEYIKQQVQQGVDREQIKSSLLTHGWEESDVTVAFAEFSGVPIPPGPASATLLGVGATLRQTWSLYKKRLPTFLGIMAMPTVVFLLLAVLMGFTAGFLGFSSASSGLLMGIVMLVGGIIGFFALFIAIAWGQTALLYAIKDSEEGIGMREAYRRGWDKILSYWWVTILAVCIILGGLFLLIIPGIIFAVWFSFALFVLVSEDTKGMNALLKSREYVRGKWWGVFWRLLSITILGILVSVIPTLIVDAFGNPGVTEVVRSVIGLFVGPFVMTYSFFVYKNSKATKGPIVFAPTTTQKASFIAAGILGILIVPVSLFLIVSASLGDAREKSRDAMRQINMSSARIGLEVYYDDNGTYPASLSELYPDYVRTPLADPVTGLPYQYTLGGDGHYEICAEMETKETYCASSDFLKTY